MFGILVSKDLLSMSVASIPQVLHFKEIVMLPSSCHLIFRVPCLEDSSNIALARNAPQFVVNQY